MSSQPRTSFLRSAAGVGIIACILLYSGYWILNRFDAGNTIRRIGSTLTLLENSIASVSIEGSELKRAENGQKLYPGDRVVTSAASNGQLTFFEETRMRLDELTDVSLIETYRGMKESVLTIRLQDGILWIQTPSIDTFSGAITRTIATPSMSLILPSNTEALIQPRSIVVYAADGIGVTVKVDGGIVPVFVGEGQKFTIPPNVESITDLYAYRSPLDPMAVQLPFVEKSRTSGTVKMEVTKVQKNQGTKELGEVLAILSPEDNETIDEATITVSGRAGNDVARVRVNGYNAPIENGSFRQELALPDADEVDIIVVALGEGGETLSEIHRQITRNREPPAPPIITKPTENGQTYQTSEERLEITGTAPEGTVGILVNDYRLQLYEPGDRKWTYLASTKIDNYKPGENIYRVYAINAGGYRSEPAVITIELGTGSAGVIEEGEEKTEDGGLGEGESNAPLQPGSIQVIAPTAGDRHESKESSFLIEGTTSTETDSLWINGYKLRLYEAGKVTWNYIADVSMNTLHRGVNTYEIVTRNAENRILDKFTYTVEFNP